MALLIDTSVAIGLRDVEFRLVDRAGALEAPALLSIVSVVELEAGAYRVDVDGADRRQALDALLDALQVLHFGKREASAYGRIIGRCGYSRRLVLDRMIAAQAIVADATLATLNPRDFAGIPGLTVEDWSA